MEKQLSELRRRYELAISEMEALAKELKEGIRKAMPALVLGLALSGFILGLMAFGGAAAASSNSTAASSASSLDLMKGYMALAMALAVGLAGVGAGYAIAGVGASTVSASVEKPETFTRGFIIVTLGEALAIYGLIVAILIWISF
ncbi:MAG: ATP synthase subunit C [Candidatus Marsarchaeota archaeon]